MTVYFTKACIGDVCSRIESDSNDPEYTATMKVGIGGYATIRVRGKYRKLSKKYTGVKNKFYNNNKPTL